MKGSAGRYNLLIFAAALLLFIPFLGAVHLFDWDEINFAECAREMITTGNYFSIRINYLPFWEKPPVFIWMQALSMRTFGVSEFAARLPDAVCGAVTLLVMFNCGRKLYDQRFGLIWVLAYAGSFLPHFYFKSGIIDPWFNLFIFLGIYHFIVFSNEKNNRPLLLSALFIGLAILTKGPVAALVFGLCFSVYWVIKRFQPVISIRLVIIYALAVAAVGGLWFLMLCLTGNAGIIKEFFIYQVRLFNTQDAGHGGPFIYHWIVLLIGCFPLSVFALRAFRKSAYDTPYQKHFKLWMMILFWVVLILFSIVKTKIVHYSSLCYFPLSFLAAYGISKLLSAELSWKKSSGILLVCISSLIGIAISALPVIDHFKQTIIDKGWIKDKFAEESLKANVSWTGVEWMIGLVLIGGTVAMLLLIRKGKLRQGIVGIFLFSLFTVSTASVMVVPRIEKYSQGAAIEFYQYISGKDCYVETISFKSYAQLFYSSKKPPLNPNSLNPDWLAHGDIDKPVYFVSKITGIDDVKQYYPDLKEIYRKNGFVFWARYPRVHH
jgi:4-amino-4-deoxy-L-arabinose transferase-like glycosyltransferase